MKTSFFEQLQSATEPHRLQLMQVPQLADALEGNTTVESYVAYLTQAYHHVRHTVPFLMSMGARLQDRNNWMQSAIAEYIEEEQGHEQWILNDIAAAGGDAVSAKASTPDLSTQLLVSYNYDYIARKNPVGFLGMVYMLESTSIAIATQGAQQLQGALGLPVEAFSYLLSHGTVDEAHIVFYQQLVDQIDNEEDKAAIIEVAGNAFLLFSRVFASIPHAARSHTSLPHAAMPRTARSHISLPSSGGNTHVA